MQIQRDIPDRVNRPLPQVPGNKRRQHQTLPGPPGKQYRVEVSGPCDTNGVFNTTRLLIPYAEFDQEQYMVRIESAIVNFGVSYNATAATAWQAPSALLMKTKSLCVSRHITDGSTNPICTLISAKSGSGGPDQVLDLNVNAASPAMATYTAPSATPISLFASYNNIRGVQKRAMYGETYCVESLGDVVCNTNLTFEFQWSVDMSPKVLGVLPVYDTQSAIPFAPTIDLVLLFYPNPFYNKTAGLM